MSDQRTTADLSSRERSQLLDAIVTQIGALTRQVQAIQSTLNANADQHGEFYTRTTRLDDELQAAKVDIQGNRIVFHGFMARPFWQRLRWLVLGK